MTKKNKRWRIELPIVVEIDAPGVEEAEEAAIDVVLNGDLSGPGDPKIRDAYAATDVSEVKPRGK